MKKISIVILVALAALSSCSMYKESSTTTMNVSSKLSSKTSAELVVSPTKLSYTYYPTQIDRKAGMLHMIANATAEALHQNGNADVLIQPETTAIYKKYIFGRKVKTVIVTGYPATYKNFKTEDVNIK